jgi:hypothetical protein
MFGRRRHAKTDIGIRCLGKNWFGYLENEGYRKGKQWIHYGSLFRLVGSISAHAYTIAAVAWLGATPMNIKSMRARMDRLDKLCDGLIVERQKWKHCDLPLFFTERQTYDLAISQAIGGVSVALAHIVQRLEQKATKKK